MLSHEEVLHIAKLARLKVSPEELETYRGQLDSILQYVAKLSEINTSGVPELAHAAGLTNVFRADQPQPCAAAVRAAALAAFPSSSGDLLEVQAVFDGRIE